MCHIFFLGHITRHIEFEQLIFQENSKERVQEEKEVQEERVLEGR